ncbi:MAG: sigma 54-interacting transcriptional regulator [Desulfobacterales bacterium]|nr:sigma 54-interacting transcriptional regulator [Desulfobacterales bacterium]
MSDIVFPFVQDFLEEKRGTLYVLSDSHVRLRDPLAILCLSRFFAAHSVDLRIAGVLAEHRRSFDETDILHALEDAPELRAETQDLFKKGSLEKCVKGLFKNAEKAHRQMLKQGNHCPRLEPRGPVLVIGRPQLYPKRFLDKVASELLECGHRHGVDGRFRCLSDDPDDPLEEFRAITDNYSGITIPCVPFFEHSNSEESYSDYGIIRMLAGSFRHRSFLFVYGTSTLGTVAAAQAVIDPDQNHVFNQLGVPSFFNKYRSVEVLLRAERRSSFFAPWVSEFEPKQIRLVGSPVAPVSSQATEWVNKFTTAEPGKPIGDLYERVDPDPHEPVTRFKIVGLHPSKDRVWHMVGGSEIKEVSSYLQEPAETEECRAILLVGPIGVGKELVARILFEERVRQLLRELASKKAEVPAPVVVGPRYVAVNCAALVRDLAESQLFGIADQSATNVRGSYGAILGAGEGIILLDELESMAMEMQAKLLRAIQPPYSVTPVQAIDPVPCSALCVAATSEEPDLLVSKGRMRADLYSRFRSCIVRIPSLAQRPGDIPALLAYIAGKPVRFDERVLRCLLADRHPHNVRGLFGIIGRARRRQQLEKATATGHALTIALEDLDEEIRNVFNDVYKEVREQRPRPDTLQLFEFEVEDPPFSPTVQDLFEEAALILSFVGANDKGEVYVRAPVKGYEHIWSKLQKEQAKSRAKRKGSIPEDTKEYGRRWFNLVERGVRSLEGKQRDYALRILGEMFSLRCSGRTRRGSKITDVFVWGYRKNRGVAQKEYATSLNMAENTFSERLANLRNERKSKSS